MVHETQSAYSLMRRFAHSLTRQRIDVGIVIRLAEDGIEGALHIAFLFTSFGFPRFSGLPLSKIGSMDTLEQWSTNHRSDKNYCQRSIQFLGTGISDECDTKEKRENSQCRLTDSPIRRFADLPICRYADSPTH
ncbi:MAG TPA: hypothetical protein PLJ24_01820 [Anaerolineae bacterium]|nr:hypothetical protein [Anaerolineae bacterium]HQJ10608.1 hypothetical protein [Anaerolineae bacterium]